MAISVKNAKPLPAGCALILGLVFLIGGLCVIWFLGIRPAARAREVRSWEAVPCVVKKAELKVSLTGADPVVEPDVIYEYSQDGREVTGSKVYDAGHAYPANELEEVLAGYRAKPERNCYVNPQNRWESVLEKPTYWAPLGLMAGGTAFALFGLLFLTRPLWKKRAGGGGGGGGCGLLAVPVICLAFAVGGGACLWFAAKDQWKEVAARMKEAPCTVLHSRVVTKTSSSRKGGSSRTYRPEVLFRYEWQGRAWHSEWADFSKNSYSSSSRNDAEEMVRRHPGGAAQSCWVDPEQPWVAVLEKSERGAWLLWILGAVFGGIGVLGLLGFLVKGVFLGVLLRKPKPPVPPPLPPEIPS